MDLLVTSFSEILLRIIVLEDPFGNTMYPDLTNGLLGNLTLSSDSVISNPAAFVASINSFKDGSKTHFANPTLLPFDFLNSY